MQCIYQLRGVSRRIIVLIFFCITLLCLSACSKSVRKVSQVNQDVPELEMLSSDDELSPLQNKTPEELLTLGYIYLQNQNLRLSRLHFVTALEKDPDFAEAYVGLGKMDMQTGEYESALGMFAAANKIDPKLITALVGQAQALRFEGKMNEAIIKINEAMSITPDDIMVLNELAIIYDLMGRENLAEPLHREIVARTPDVASSHNNLGMNQMVNKQYLDAILSFMQALSLDQDNKRIKNNLAAAYALNGDEERALAIFTRTVGEAAAYNNIGYLYLTQGRLDEAEQFLRKALTANPMYYEKAQDNLDKIQQLRRQEIN